MVIDKEIIGIIIWVIVIIGTILYFKWDIDTTLKDNRLALKPCYRYKDVDKEIYRLVRMLNCIPYLYTTCSCSGHDTNSIRIWFNIPAKKVNFVMHYFFNHLDFKDWVICVETADPDLKSKEVSFYLESKRMVSEMKDEINALCENILCVMLENEFKPKE